MNISACPEISAVCRIGLFGHIGFWVAAVAAVLLIAVVGYLLIAKRNGRRNAQADRDPAATTRNRLINDQNLLTGSRFRYGLYRAARNSCEIIAVHNAKVLMGMDSSLSETVKAFQSAWGMIGYGRLGSDPFSIGRVLARSGIGYSHVKLTRMTAPGIYIISFWNPRPLKNGLHTVAVRYDGARYTAYNLKCDGRVYPIELSEYTRSFICGYYLG